MGELTRSTNAEPVSRRQIHRRKTHRVHWIVVLIMILIGGLVAGGVWWRGQQQSALKAYAVRGVSVDQDDGYLDFHQLQNAGVKFVYLKSTSGASYLDDNFLSNYARISGTTLQVGIYQEFSFSSSAQRQYQYLVSQVGQQSGNLPIAIHVTLYGKYATHGVNYQKQGQKLAELVQLLSDRYGQGCIVWATPQMQRKLVMPYVANTKQWVVTKRLKRQNAQVKFMQYTGNERLRVAGKETDLTVSVFNGSKRDWKEEVN